MQGNKEQDTRHRINVMNVVLEFSCRFSQDFVKILWSSQLGIWEFGIPVLINFHFHMIARIDNAIQTDIEITSVITNFL